MKKRQLFLYALSLSVSAAAFGGVSVFADSDYSSQTITAKVTGIDDSSVDLQVGELNLPEKPDDAGNAAPGSDGSADSDAQTPPEKPDDTGNAAPGSDGSSDNNAQTPPEKPDDANNAAPGSDGSADSDAQTPLEMPNGGGMDFFTAGDDTLTLDFADTEILVENGNDTEEGSLDDIAADSILSIEFDENGDVAQVTVLSTRPDGMGGNGEIGAPDGFGGPGGSGAPGGNGAPDGSGAPGGNGAPGGFGGSGEVTQGDAATTISEDSTVSDETYTSTGDDENALRIDGATVTLDGITVDKSSGSSSNTEDGDFYGMNAALLATDGADVTITGATVTSSAQNGNGVFSYGEGTTVTISDSTITTTADNSGGIQTTGGATTNASGLTVDTSGNSAAAIRSDRGGGTVNVNGGTYTSNGYNSPAVYSTAAISVSDAALTANHSEALVIEGQNSITLDNCDVSGNMSDTEGTSSDENVHNVMIYQSMSGDAEVGTSSFTMNGGTLTSNNGDMFYVTNTHCTIELTGVTLTNNDSDAYLLNVTGNSASHGWGTAGSNGAQVEFTAADQTLDGDIIVDSISTLDLTLSGSSSFTGTINITENADGGTAVDDNAVVTIEEGSTWTLTGDCTITSLTNNGTIDFNGHTITLADGTVLSE